KRRKQLTLVLDALDEAAVGQRQLIVQEFVQPLSRLVRVLVGTRNPPVAGGEGGEASLLELMPEGTVIEDLGGEPGTGEDITTYIERRLSAVRAWSERPLEAAAVARAVAEVAVGDGGGFLLARVIGGRLRRLSPTDKQWRAQLQLSITEALDED